MPRNDQKLRVGVAALVLYNYFPAVDYAVKAIKQLRPSRLHWSNKLAGAVVEDDFWLQLNDLNLAQYLINGIWPSSDVTPESLGTEEVGGINTVDYTSDLIERQCLKQQTGD